jgi:magnesium transporter
MRTQLMTDPIVPEHAVAPSTALAHASLLVPTAQPGERVADIRRRLVGADRFDTVTQIAVLDDERIVGTVRIEDLLASEGGSLASAIMDPDPPVVRSGVDQETAAAKAVLHEESGLAVVDSDGRFLGLIPPHRMLGVLLEEHREDLARLSGYLHQSAGARSASEERLVLRFWHRFPWLVVGLAAALAAAVVVAAFESGLASRLELAFFIPGVVYIAGAVGNQTVVLVVRGLSVGVPVGRVMGREMITGMALGIVLGGIAYPAVRLWFDHAVGLTVAVSILVASTVSTGVAIALPWLLSKLNIDPAFGSGPLSTVVQDLMTLTIYFSLASRLVL